ncbi:MAG: RluA family pseudouridine synthase [Simkaniaceae bacterium]|nr:RluA family pseudouridine synthase [Simkaniaceae bacterium]
MTNRCKAKVRKRRQAQFRMKRSPSRGLKAAFEGESLASALQREIYPGDSRRKVKRGVDAKGVLVNGAPKLNAALKLRLADRIEVFEEAFEQDTSLQAVLFEDEHFIAYDKPVGFVCEEPLQVHRLDKETSGVYLIAKSEKALEAMTKLFKAREVHKEYRAIVRGIVIRDGGKIESYLDVSKKSPNRKIWASAPKGHYARTDWEKLATGDGCTLLKIKPKTGRTHQIRVHMSEMGHPVLGDYVYARAFPHHAVRHMLHALRLGFVHPFTGNYIEIISPCAF